MLIFEDIASLQHFLKEKKFHHSIGFVPTMGALHEGHMSLIKASKAENDITVCSIFVNPRQFNNPDDLKKYPRDIDKDKRMLKQAGCDALFIPAENEMYASNPAVVSFSFGYLENIMEGKYRPGHFNGVGVVVTKLFNIVAPNKAYFGQKDLQQFIVIKSLVEELNMDVSLRRMPIIRESDGLAMSSRNMRLDENARKKALIFYHALNDAMKMLEKGESVEFIKEHVEEMFNNEQEANLEYFEIVNAQNLSPLEKGTSEDVAFCMAGYVGGVRLIDNMIL